MSNYPVAAIDQLAPDRELHMFRALSVIPRVEDFLAATGEYSDSPDEHRDGLKAGLADVAINGFVFHAKFLALCQDGTISARMSAGDLYDLIGPSSDHGLEAMQGIEDQLIADLTRHDSGSPVSGTILEREPERTGNGLVVTARAGGKSRSAPYSPAMGLRAEEQKDEPVSLDYEAGIDGQGVYKRLVQRWKLGWHNGQLQQSLGIATVRPYYVSTGDWVRLAARSRFIEPDGDLVDRTMHRRVNLADGLCEGDQSLSFVDQQMIDGMFTNQQ